MHDGCMVLQHCEQEGMGPCCHRTAEAWLSILLCAQMLEFGMEHPGSYMKSKSEGLKDHGKHYPSSNTNDEMAWGALWLYFATGVRRPAASSTYMLCKPVPSRATLLARAPPRLYLCARGVLLG